VLIDNRRMQTATFRQIASYVATAALAVFIAPLHAQTRLTADDYSRAEQFLGYNTNRLVLHLAAQPTWVGDDRLWYRTTTENGTEFFQVDAATGARTPAFDQAKIAAALSSAARSNYAAVPAAVQSVRIQHRPQGHFLQRRRKPVDVRCGGDAMRQQAAASGAAVRRLARRQTRRLHPQLQLVGSRHGIRKRNSADERRRQEYGYATDNAGWIHSDNAILLWSPDSKKIATFQQDERGTGDMYLVSTAVGHPRLEAGSTRCRVTPRFS
jgi:hypothetical protein